MFYLQDSNVLKGEKLYLHQFVHQQNICEIKSKQIKFSTASCILLIKLLFTCQFHIKLYFYFLIQYTGIKLNI